MSSKKAKNYFADLETTTQTNYIKERRVRVWSAGVRDIETLEITHNSKNIRDFMDYCLNTSVSRNIYLHNLKFDGTFILDYLFKNGYRHKHPNARKIGVKEFDTLITDMGAWFAIEIVIKRLKKRVVKVKFMDSLKKLPFSIAEIAEIFNLDTKKGDIDYHKDRPVGYEPTQDEWDYLNTDTFIGAKAMQEMFNLDMRKMTLASDAMFFYKTLKGKEFDYLFPVLNEALDNDIRASYRGGWTYADPRYKSREIGLNVSYDQNSMYPATMYNKKLPYGLPKHYTGKYTHDKNYPLFIQLLEIDITLKENHLPTLQIKNNLRFKPTDYITTTEGEPVKLFLTSVDYELLKKHYNIHSIEYLEGYKFRGQIGMFEDYINYWYDIKENSTGTKRLQAKLMLNSLYGKFAIRVKSGKIVPYYDRDLTEVKYNKKIETTRDPIYTAIASFITAYSREGVITAGQDNYDRFLYADTDSIHLTGDELPKGLEIHEKKLGAWACEGVAKRAKFIRAKTYIKEYEDGTTSVTCAGMPTKVKQQVSFENFKGGAIYSGKIQGKKVRGGTILNDVDFTIK